MIAEKRKISKRCRQPGESSGTGAPYTDDWVASEVNMAIRLNRDWLVSIACSPVDCIDLAIGYLFTEELIQSLHDIEVVTFDPVSYELSVIVPDLSGFEREEWLKGRSLTSGCGGGSASRIEYRRKTLRPVSLRIDHTESSIFSLVEYVKRTSEWHTKTGCIHQAVLAYKQTAIVREDIGRHNAIDKAIGAGLICGVDFSTAIIYCSGRASSDMVMKTAHAGIPVIVSRSAPTSLAIDIAEKSGVTLIGFARARRFNVYSHIGNIHRNEHRDFGELETISPRSQAMK